MVKNEHYIPRFYLQQFATKDKICVYNIKEEKIFQTNIKKIAVHNYFYDATPDDLRDELEIYREIFNISTENFEAKINNPQFIEEAFSRLENKMSNYIKKFEADYSLIHDEEFLRTLFLFLHTLSIRTLSYRNILESINTQTSDWLKSLNIANISNYDLSKSPKENAKLSQLKNIISLQNTYKKAERFFENYDIFVGVNNTDMDFLISDNPLLNFYLGFNDICFPINPRLAIIMQVSYASEKQKICNFVPDSDGIVNLKVMDVLKYNLLQENSNANYLFGKEKMINRYLRYINQIKRLKKYQNKMITNEVE